MTFSSELQDSCLISFNVSGVSCSTHESLLAFFLGALIFFATGVSPLLEGSTHLSHQTSVLYKYMHANYKKESYLRVGCKLETQLTSSWLLPVTSIASIGLCHPSPCSGSRTRWRTQHFWLVGSGFLSPACLPEQVRSTACDMLRISYSKWVENSVTVLLQFTFRAQKIRDNHNNITHYNVTVL